MSSQWLPCAAGFLLSLLVTQPCIAHDSKQREFDSWYKGRNSPVMVLVHSWYSDKCCHDKDCHPVSCEEIEKISDGWLWRDKATKQRHWFPRSIARVAG